MATTYLIDYENVHENGLVGMHRLQQDDFVYIMYTANANKLNMDFLAESSAPYMFKRVPILTAVNSHDEGFSMTVYCGILELLAGEGEAKPKEITDEIDKLINQVQESNLSKEHKNELIGFLTQGKNTSSRQRCKALIRRYAKEKYGKYKATDIFNNAYGLRSSYSHGNKQSDLFDEKAAYMFLIVLDVLGGYMRDRQQSQ